MKSQPNQGRSINRIFFTGPDSPQKSFPSDIGETATLEEEFHGDHDEDWIVVRDHGGKEVERWNARMLEGIRWQ